MRKAFSQKRKIARQAPGNKLSLAEMNPPTRSPKAGGLNPCLQFGRVEATGYLSQTACGSVGFLCQLGHIGEKRVRLADEETHVP